MNRRDSQAASGELAAAGLPGHEVDDWLAAEPGAATDFAADRTRFAAFWQKSACLVARLPPPARRNERERLAARTIQETARAARVRFLASHGDAVYDKLTDGRSRFVRVEHLVTEAARVVPGLVPE